MTPDLNGQVVLVTGAGRGIGRALALAFGSANATIVAMSRTLAQVESTVEAVRRVGGDGEAIAGDVTRVSDIDRMIGLVTERFGRIDVLLNNAGIMRSGSILEMSEADWALVLDINLKGTFLCTQRVGRILAAQGHGKIINVGSTFGRVPVRQHAAYCASKAALVRFTEVAALELAPHNIQVNAIAPGYVQTELNADILADPENYEKVLRRIPLKRVLGTNEVAPAALFLASPNADYITGETLYIDGGYKLT